MYNIAISANTSWYLYNFRRNTILSLISNGYSVTAIAPRDEYSIKLEELGAEYLEVNIDQGGTNPFKDMKTFFDLFKIFSSKNYFIVLNFTPKNNIYSTLAAKLNNVTVINNIAGLGVLFIKTKSLKSIIARTLYKFSQKYADRVFFQNEDDRELFISNKLVDRNITDRLPGSGVDLSRFVYSPSENDGVVRFLLVARMLYDKGIGYYVEAARELKNRYGDLIEFRLLGFLDVDNPSAVSSNEMQGWVDEGIINYLGTSDKVESEIAKVDCMVLPSFYREGVPKSLLEAGAMGKPIVTTDNVGCRDTVDEGVNGFLCRVKSANSLVVQLDRIFQLSHEERLNMGRESREKMSREFNEKIVINKYLDAIDKSINK
ncbi:MAG: glycosyltransferase family 4 protein [Endozoicomonadaceae bacterium]|nr:glycosyltransferase family 4 protein [Endozoicomonadaceae bacterium]